MARAKIRIIIWLHVILNFEELPTIGACRDERLKFSLHLSAPCCSGFLDSVLLTCKGVDQSETNKNLGILLPLQPFSISFQSISDRVV